MPVTVRVAESNVATALAPMPSPAIVMTGGATTLSNVPFSEMDAKPPPVGAANGVATAASWPSVSITAPPP